MSSIILSEWTIHKTSSDELEKQYGVFDIHSKKLNGTINNLVVIAGFSENSGIATRDVINKELDRIANNYISVYVIILQPFKELQKENDRIDSERKLTLSIDDPEYRKMQWANDIMMKDQLATIVDKIIRANNINNVHLLGKSAGGGLAMNIVSKSDIYKKLYLAVPAHPLFCDSLIRMGDKLNDLPVCIGWNYNDKYNLYNIESNKQMPYYESILIKLQAQYPNFLYKQALFSPGNMHEVNPGLLYL